MSVLIWLVLFFCVRDNKCDGAANVKQTCQHQNYCIGLSEGEIPAEDGLCVVLPCAFTTNDEFKVTSVNWYKCKSDSTEICHENNSPIFNSSNNQNIQSGFGGRVSMLEPNLSQKNCSIIINDINASDNGSYQLRLTGFLKGKIDGFTFTSKANIIVKGLDQKPTVMVPPLTAGQQNTLTCTAPGLCSGSVPEFTWTWRKTGENNSYITGNITDTKTENVSDVTRRHSSTLTFNLSADNHNTEVTCKVNFRGNLNTKEKVTLNVNYVNKPKISGTTTVKLGDTLNLSCSVDSFPASFINWTKPGCNCVLHEQTQGGSASLIIHHMTANSSGQYICTATNQWKNLTAQTEVIVTAIDINLPVINNWLQVILGFFAVIFVSASIVCLSRKCHRTKPKNSGNLSENIEMASTQFGLQADDVEPKEVEYSDIDFSILKRRNHTKVEETREAEYSEIGKGAIVQRHNDKGEAEETVLYSTINKVKHHI